MVSDFIDEHNGFLALTDNEYEEGKEIYPDPQQKARTLLKYGAEFEGYWNSEKFLKQMEAAIKIVKIKYLPGKINLPTPFKITSRPMKKCTYFYW